MARYHEESLDCRIRGFHVYQDIWTPVNGERFTCIREPINVIDRYAVAIAKDDGTVVGHLPRKISTVISLYILQRGQVAVEVTRTRRHSTDLVQGGMEIPCKLILRIKEKKKLEKILNLIDRLMAQ